MADYWIYYAIAASICIGLYWFAQKIKAEMPHQSDNGFIAYSYVAMSLGGIFGSLIFWHTLQLTDSFTILYALWITSFYIVIVKTRLISLRYLSSSTYFINYRIASSLWLLIVWVTLFSERISFQEWLWIMIWFIVFYLLIEKKYEKESFTDMKKGFLYLFIGSLAVTWVQTLAKSFATSDADIFSLVFFQGIFWVMFVLLLKWKEPVKKIFEVQHTRQALFLILSGIVFWLATIVNNYALIWGDLAIVYKIISYSLFIPIILSIIIYKEQVTPKKLCAFVLTLMSIFLFV